MNQEINNYPGLKSVVLEIGYDNGIIYRNFSEDQWLSNVNEFIGAEGVYHEDLKKWSDWLSTFSEDQISTIAAGNEDEMVEIMKECPDWQNLNDLLNEIFMSSEI